MLLGLGLVELLTISHSHDMSKLELQVFNRVTKFLDSISDDEQLKIGAEIESVRDGDFESTYIKTLRGPIKELIR